MPTDNLYPFTCLYDSVQWEQGKAECNAQWDNVPHSDMTTRETFNLPGYVYTADMYQSA